MNPLEWVNENPLTSEEMKLVHKTVSELPDESRDFVGSSIAIHQIFPNNYQKVTSVFLRMEGMVRLFDDPELKKICTMKADSDRYFFVREEVLNIVADLPMHGDNNEVFFDKEEFRKRIFEEIEEEGSG